MRKTIALVVAAWLLLGLCAGRATAQTPAPAEPSGAFTRAVHTAIAGHVVAQFADVSTTEYALGTGHFAEHNPLLKWASHDPIPMAIVKGSFAVATSYLLLRMHRQHPKIALVTAIGLTAVTSWAAHANARAIRADRR